MTCHVINFEKQYVTEFSPVTFQFGGMYLVNGGVIVPGLVLVSNRHVTEMSDEDVMGALAARQLHYRALDQDCEVDVLLTAGDSWDRRRF